MITAQVQMPPKLPEILRVLHDLNGKSDEQTIRNGTQINLEKCPYKSVSKLLQALKPEIDAYIGEPWKFAGVWSSRMSKGGYHIAHNHPKGEVSGCYYVAVGKGADLRVGQVQITPQAGMVVLFDSKTPHGTTEYEGDEPRVTIAFDVVRGG